MVWGSLAGRLQPKKQDMAHPEDNHHTSSTTSTETPISNESSSTSSSAETSEMTPHDDAGDSCVNCISPQSFTDGDDTAAHDDSSSATNITTTTTTTTPIRPSNNTDHKRKKISDDNSTSSNSLNHLQHQEDDDDEEHYEDDDGQDHADDGSSEDPNASIVWQPQDQQSTCEFVHIIENYSQKRESGCKMAEYSATTIDNLGNRWRLIIYVNGNGRASNHHLSLFLQVADADDLPFGWKKAVSYVLTLEHPNGSTFGYAKRNPDKTFKLCPKAIDWGWSQFITSDRIQQDGYIQNDSLTVRASVTVKSSSINIDPEDSELYLKYAVEEGNAEAVETCLSQGASVNCQFKDDLYTPLHTACSSNASEESFEVLELLLKRGADGNACNKWRETPLLIAANNGHRAAVEALLSHGADPSMCSEAGWSALTFAAHKGYDDIVELLLAAGAPVNCKVIEDCSTPLHKACAGSKDGHLSSVNQLIAGGADVHALNKWRETPLLTAANHGQASAVKALLKAGADPCRCTDTGWSPLSIAAYKGHDDVVELLLEHGAPTEEYDPTLSALLQAATKGLPKTVEILLRNGADHTVTTKKGDTALSILVEQNLIDAAVEMVTDYKASISRCSRDRKKVQRARLQINLRMKQMKERGSWKDEDDEGSDEDDVDVDDDSKSGIGNEGNSHSQNGKKSKKNKTSVSAEEKAKAAAEELLLALEMEESKAIQEEAAANSKRNKKKKKKEREKQQKLEQEKLEQEKLEKEAKERERQKRIREEEERKQREAKLKEQKEREMLEVKERKKNEALKKKEREAIEKIRLEKERIDREQLEKREAEKLKKAESLRKQNDLVMNRKASKEDTISRLAESSNNVSLPAIEQIKIRSNHSGSSQLTQGEAEAFVNGNDNKSISTIYPMQAPNHVIDRNALLIEPACVSRFRAARVKDLLNQLSCHPLSSVDGIKIKSALYAWISRASDTSLARIDPIIPSWTDSNVLMTFFQRQLISEYKSESQVNKMLLMESGKFIAELCLSLAIQVSTFKKTFFASLTQKYSDVSTNMNCRELLNPVDGSLLISIDFDGQSPLYIPSTTFANMKKRYRGSQNLLYTAIYSTLTRYELLEAIADGTQLSSRISHYTMSMLGSSLNVSAELWSSPMSAIGENAFCGVFSDVDTLFGGLQAFLEPNTDALSLFRTQGCSAAVLPSQDSYVASCFIKRMLDVLEVTNGKGVPVSFVVFLPKECFRDLQKQPSIEHLSLLDPRLLQSHRAYITHVEILAAHQHTLGTITGESKVSTSGSLILFLQNDSGRVKYRLTAPILLQIKSTMVPVYSDRASASPTPFIVSESNSNFLPSSPPLAQQISTSYSEPHYTPGTRAPRNRRLFELVDDGNEDPVEVVEDVLSNLDIASLDIGIFQDSNTDVDIEAISLGMNFSNPTNHHGNSSRTHGRFG